MSKNDAPPQDPLEFVRNMWGGMGFTLPGMMTPTLDVDELDKRVADMKAVESWLKMNLNMLQMTIQGLEMQRATIAAVKAMSEQAPERPHDAPPSPEHPFAAASMWPWNLMQSEPAEKDPDEEAAPPQGKTEEQDKSKPAQKKK